MSFVYGKGLFVRVGGFLLKPFLLIYRFVKRFVVRPIDYVLSTRVSLYFLLSFLIGVFNRPIKNVANNIYRTVLINNFFSEAEHDKEFKFIDKSTIPSKQAWIKEADYWRSQYHQMLEIMNKFNLSEVEYSGHIKSLRREAEFELEQLREKLSLLEQRELLKKLVRTQQDYNKAMEEEIAMIEKRNSQWERDIQTLAQKADLKQSQLSSSLG